MLVAPMVDDDANYYQYILKSVYSWLLFCKSVHLFLPCMLVVLTVQMTVIYILYIYIERERERERERESFLYFLRIRCMNLNLYTIDKKLKRHFAWN